MSDSPQNGNPSENHDANLMKKIRFRNYRPRSEDLKKYVEETDPANKHWEQWEAQYESEMADAEHKFANPSTDLTILAPKKINWDLKMQFEPKARLLQRHTHRALLEIVRDNVAANAGNGANADANTTTQGKQLAQAVAQATASSSDDDDELSAE